MTKDINSWGIEDTYVCKRKIVFKKEFEHEIQMMNLDEFKLTF